MVKKIVVLLPITFLVFFFTSIDVHAEAVGDSLTVPISFTSSDPVTAADITITVSGGTLTDLTCGGDGFSDLGTGADDQCVVFHTSGATTGVIATASVLADTAGTLTVSAEGTFSTSQGVEPTTVQINGDSFTITGTSSGGGDNGGSPTPTTTQGFSNPTATPTLANTAKLPDTGVVENTIVLFIFAFIALGSGYGLLKR